MRHFLLATRSIAGLARRVRVRTAPTALIASTGFTHAAATPHTRAAGEAVDVSVIAAPADTHLRCASCATVQPVARLDRHRPSRREAGQRLAIKAFSHHCWRVIASIATHEKARGISLPRAFAFSARPSCYSNARQRVNAAPASSVVGSPAHHTRAHVMSQAR